ncbi:glycosyltransferase family 4 protein [Calderihabitans maritimus]|uniref:Glycosyl transferase n=1 Tax=Calderihabitans maritimus TaxID=1246530 RepID=A0A1Z5HWV0_9FIRM|nr:glycosyltransferase family 4 protein [Calderihabitans maritimus]GAW94006.1 glycosyl transferase [Calderihabitans maritimus]
MKVLVLSHMYPNEFNPSYGLFVHQQVTALQRLGLECRVVAPVPWTALGLGRLNEKWNKYASTPERENLEGVTVYHPRVITFPRNFWLSSSGWFYYYGIKSFVAQLTREFPFDLIHAHVALPDGYGAVLLKRQYAKPVVVTIHGLDVTQTVKRSIFCRRAVQTTLNRSDKIIAVSTMLAELTAKYVKEEQKVTVVHNGISPELLYKGESPLRERFKNKKVILTVAALIKLKGYDYTLRALREIKENVPEFVFIIVGDGPEKRELQRLVSELGLDHNVVFAGRQPHHRTMEYMSICDVFVMPSWKEGFGVVYLEAMAHGKPVIACKGQGIQDLIVNGVNGILVEPKDVGSLAEALKNLLLNSELRQQIGWRARETVLNGYTWEDNARKMTEIYKGIVSRKRSNGRIKL